MCFAPPLSPEVMSPSSSSATTVFLLIFLPLPLIYFNLPSTLILKSTKRLRGMDTGGRKARSVCGYIWSSGSATCYSLWAAAQVGWQSEGCLHHCTGLWTGQVAASSWHWTHRLIRSLQQLSGHGAESSKTCCSSRWMPWMNLFSLSSSPVFSIKPYFASYLFKLFSWRCKILPPKCFVFGREVGQQGQELVGKTCRWIRTYAGGAEGSVTS